MLGQFPRTRSHGAAPQRWWPVIAALLIAQAALGQLVITTTSLPAATVGVPYSTTVAAAGGTGSYTWSATGLPAPLTIATGTGVITGTPATNVGSPFSVTVTVSDGVSPPVNQVFSLVVNPVTITTASLAAATVATTYTATVAAAGGTGSYTWSATGLPPGLSIEPATGVISGTPTSNVGSPFSVTVTVSDGVSPPVNQVFSLVVNPVTITTASLAAATVATTYTATVAAAGGTGSYTWSATGLPPGLSIEPATGVISGTPTSNVGSPFGVTVTVSDGASPPVSQVFSLVVNPVSITTTALPAGTVNQSYAATLVAVGGMPPYTWSHTGLPGWLTLNETTGALTGTPTSAGIYYFTVRVTDSGTPAQTASRELSLTVASGLVVVTSSLPGGTVGVVYSQTLVAAGGTLPYLNWQVAAGSLPPGLSLGAATGLITGIPTTTGAFSFTVQVRDSGTPTPQTATKALSINVASGLVVATASLPGGTVGVSYSQTLAAAGGTLPYTWSVTGGALPTGLTLAATGQIIGTPATAGPFTFTVQVTDSAAVTASRTFSITITSALAITTAALPAGVVGASYTQTVAASGGTPPYIWSIASQTLPPGLSLGTATGQITGTPNQAGTFSFTVQVTDSSTPAAAYSKAFSITITGALAVTSPAQLPAGVVDVAYSQTLAAAGGTTPYTWALIAGTLPAGLTLSNAGVVSGKPTTAAMYTFTVQVTDSAGRRASLEMTLTVAQGFTITSESPLPAGAVGVSYSYTLAAAGGAPPYSEWKVISGILPTGLSLEAASGRLSGTPTSATTFFFEVQVRDSAGKTASKSFTLTIQAAALAIATASPLPSGVMGSAYSHTLQASGGIAPYAWAVKEGSLPAGLGLDAFSGRISGTPSAVGSSSFTIEVTDAARRTASKPLTLVIGPPPLAAVQITGPPDTAGPAQQTTVRLTLASGYPLDITGELTLKFDPDAVNPADDPAVQFSTDGRTVNFSIAANATEATFPAASLGLQTGTVAGNITLRATFRAGGSNVTPSPTPERVIRLLRSAPAIRSVEVVKTASGFEVLVKGFSTPREVTQATYGFSPASGANLQTTVLALPMTQLSDQWFRGQESGQFGSQFTLRQPFTVQGDVGAISAVSVTLTNSVGSSQAVSSGL